MADHHPIWRGQLRLALVSCPVALFTANRPANELHFHFINPKTGHRVRSVMLDAETDEEVSRRDLTRGYEFRKDEYVLMEDEDFEHAKIDSSGLLGIDKFVPAAAIDPVYFDASYYLAPDGDAGSDVFVVLRDAIRQTGQVALSRLVISRRERAVAIMSLEHGLVLHTLHDAADIAAPAEVFAAVPTARPDAAMVKLAAQLIERQAGTFDPADMQDRYAARLREVIDAKLAGQDIAPEPEAAEPDNVIDLMAALKRSLGQGADTPARKKAPAGGKAAPKAKPAAKPKAAAKPVRKRA